MNEPPASPAAPLRLAWLPNALTMARVALAPAILATLLPPSLGRVEPFVLSPWAAGAAGLLLLAGLLDFLDGRLARALGVESAFGRFWDPVADKLVIGAALVGGAFALPSMLFLLPAALLLWRDGMVTWLRMRPSRGAPSEAVATPSRLAKWKTALEYAALALVFSAGLLALLAPAAAQERAHAVLLAVGLGALWLACALSLATGWRYLALARRACPAPPGPK